MKSRSTPMFKTPMEAFVAGWKTIVSQELGNYVLDDEFYKRLQNLSDEESLYHDWKSIGDALRDSMDVFGNSRR